MTRHYLDHNATTPPLPEVIERYVEVESQIGGNPSSIHGPGRRARGIVEDARAEVAEVLGVEHDDVVFVAGGTEANNLAVFGLGDPHRPILVSLADHASVLAPAEVRGCVHAPLDPSGRPILDAVAQDVGAVCITYGQSEVGTLPDVAAAAAFARQRQVPLHVDLAQALGRLPLATVLSEAVTASITVHKAGGLRGQGVLVQREPGAVRPHLHGGGQEAGLSPGTTSPALVAATALAVRRAVEDTRRRSQAMHTARDAFDAAMAAAGHRIVAGDQERLPNTTMIAFEGVDGRSFLPALDIAGVHASQGSACSSGSSQPAAILRGMGWDDDDARRTLRFSFGANDALEFAQDAARIVLETFASLRSRADERT